MGAVLISADALELLRMAGKQLVRNSQMLQSIGGSGMDAREEAALRVAIEEANVALGDEPSVPIIPARQFISRRAGTGGYTLATGAAEHDGPPRTDVGDTVDCFFADKD